MSMTEEFVICINGKQMPCTFIRNLKVEKAKKRRKVKISKYVVVLKADYPGLTKKLYFCSRNAAIMWLKRYGKEFVPYRLNDKAVCVYNNCVWFYENSVMNPGRSAESKRTCNYAIRNN